MTGSSLNCWGVPVVAAPQPMSGISTLHNGITIGGAAMSRVPLKT